MDIPTDTQTVTAEGGDLKSALNAAAAELGVGMEFVAHKLDLSHFRSVTGGMVPKNTVKIIAWQSEEPVNKNVVAPPRDSRSDDGDRPSRDRGERRSRDRGDRGERRSRDRGDRGERRSRDRDRGERRSRDRGDRGERRPREDRSERPQRRGAEEGSTPASDFAAEWMQGMVGHLGLEGTVSGTGSDDRIHLDVKVESNAGRLIGKRGATLRSVRRLLLLALERHHTGDRVLDVDVNDDRPKPERSARGDRNGNRRGRDRRRDGDGRGRYPEEKLTALAERAVEKAKSTGQTITIKLELNSYDRRILHVTVSEHEGVESHSEEIAGMDADGNEVMLKYVQVVPNAAE